jgi:outer membrane protein assembly factor BamC
MKAVAVDRAAEAALRDPALALSGCESMNLSSMSKKHRLQVHRRRAFARAAAGPQHAALRRPLHGHTASGLAARERDAPKQSDLLPTNPEARIARAGNERWLVVKATPEQAWSVTRQFWTETGFVIATEQPTLGVMETDWAENRAEIPQDLVRSTIGKYIDIFYSTYKRDKFRSRIERGVEPGTVEIYLSHRGMEQVPTATSTARIAAGFAWAAMPPNPNLEAEMLSRLMMRFGPEPRRRPRSPRRAALRRRRGGWPRARAPREGRPTAEAVRRRSVRSRMAARRARARPQRLHRRRSRSLERPVLTCATRDPDGDMSKKDREKSWLAKLAFWKTDDEGQARAVPHQGRRVAPQSVVSVQDAAGAPEVSKNGEKILAPAQGTAQVARRCASPPSAAAAKATGLAGRAGTTRVLIDCGFGVRRPAARLRGWASSRNR